MLTVIRFKNNLTKTYQAYSFIKEDYKQFTKELHDDILLHPEELIKRDLHISTCFLVGYYDQETGVLTPAENDMPFNLQDAFDQRKALEASVHVN